MAKRFADTGLTREKWFRKLALAHKCAWRFLADECSLAGIIPADEEAIQFYIGAPIDIDEFIAAVNQDGKSRVRRLDNDKLYLPLFAWQQYGVLSPDCNPHKPVIKELHEHGLWDEYLSTLPKGLGNPSATLHEELPKGSVTLKDKDQDQDPEKKEKGGLGEKTKSAEPPKPTKLKFDFEAIYQNYPRKPEGHTEGIKRCEEQIKTQEDYDALARAVDRYAAEIKKKNIEIQYVKHFGSFLGTKRSGYPWHDWRGKAEDPPPKPAAIEGEWVEDASHPAGGYIRILSPSQPQPQAPKQSHARGELKQRNVGSLLKGIG